MHAHTHTHTEMHPGICECMSLCVCMWHTKLVLCCTVATLMNRQALVGILCMHLGAKALYKNPLQVKKYKSQLRNLTKIRMKKN